MKTILFFLCLCFVQGFSQNNSPKITQFLEKVKMGDISKMEAYLNSGGININEIAPSIMEALAYPISNAKNDEAKKTIDFLLKNKFNPNYSYGGKKDFYSIIIDILTIVMI